MVELKDHSSRSAAVEKVTLDSRSVDDSQRTLSVDTSGLAPAMPISELKEGDFAVAIGRSEIASGVISNLKVDGDGLRVRFSIPDSPKEPSTLYPLTWVDDVISLHRVTPQTAIREPGRLARFFGAKPQSYSIPPRLSEIFGQKLPLESIGLADQGLPILIQEDQGYRWSIHTILTVEGSGISFESKLGTQGLGVYTTRRDQSITARIFR